MNLKEFIEETISAIVEATTSLQTKFEAQGTIINPPVSVTERDLYEVGSSSHRYRRVETVEFDVAVTAASETGSGGRAGLKIFSAEAGVEGKRTNASEEVSRVKFAIPLVLSPAASEAANRAKREREEHEYRAAEADYNPMIV
jgi:hypothetical protein